MRMLEAELALLYICKKEQSVRIPNKVGQLPPIISSLYLRVRLSL